MISKDDGILITGASGFLGGHVLEEFKRNGYSNLFPVSSHDLDLLNNWPIIYEFLRRKIPERPIRGVIHLAAKVGGIKANQDNPAGFFEENLLMGMNLYRAICCYNSTFSSSINIDKVLVIGTVCSYPKYTPVPFKESDFWNGYPEETNAPYGIAKKSLYVYGNTLRQSHGLNTVFVIPTNLVGENDNFDLNTSHVIPALINKFAEAVDNDVYTVHVWGDGSVSREFLYAGDCAYGIRLAFEEYDDGEILNLGTGQEVYIRDLAHMISGKVGFKGEIKWDISKPNGQPRRCLDVTRARDLLKFEPKVSLEEAIEKTMRWYNENLR